MRVEDGDGVCMAEMMRSGNWEDRGCKAGEETHKKQLTGQRVIRFVDERHCRENQQDRMGDCAYIVKCR